VKTIGVRKHCFLICSCDFNVFSIEKQLEDEEELEKNLNKDKLKRFQDEDAYDSEEEKKKKQEELKI